MKLIIMIMPLQVKTVKRGNDIFVMSGHAIACIIQQQAV